MPGQQPRQRKHHRYNSHPVLAYIEKYQQTHNHRSPSQRRIQIDLRFSAPSVVHNLLHRLQQSGLLTITTYGRGHTSDLMLTEAGHEAVERWQKERRAADNGAFL